LNIIYSVDRTELHFTFDQGWHANYELEITFGAGKKRMGGDFWQKTVTGTLATYYDSIKIRIPDSARFFRLKVIVPEIGSIFEGRQNMNPEKVLSRIRFSTSRSSSGDQIYYLHDTLLIDFNIRYRVDSLIYRITQGRKVLQQKVLREPELGDGSILIILEGLDEGRYEHRFIVLNDVDEENVIRFYLEIPFYYSEDKYNEMVEQLRYIASPQDLTRLKNAKSSEERLKAYEDFWTGKDPTPGTDLNELKEEYLARVRYAEEHFKRGDLGWRSDRGKVYIKYGPPDEIDSHPFEAETRAYEVWFYYGKNRKFIFIDRYGFGRYELFYPEGGQI